MPSFERTFLVGSYNVHGSSREFPIVSTQFVNAGNSQKPGANTIEAFFGLATGTQASTKF